VPRNAFRTRACLIVMIKFSGHAVISKLANGLCRDSDASVYLDTSYPASHRALCAVAAMLLDSYRASNGCTASRLDSPRHSLLPTNQSSQCSLREVSNPPISAVQISLQAISESLQFLWRLDAPGDHIPKLIALACEDALT
jgi:hypothetical protein